METDTSSLVVHPLVNRIFTVDLILLEILKPLQHKDLLQCRALNSKFEQLATQIILSNSPVPIRFTYNWNLKEFEYSSGASNATHRSILNKKFELREEEEEVRKTTLASFSELFRTTSTSFPCTSFVFASGTLNSPDLQHFMNCIGRGITWLYLDMYCPPQYAKQFIYEDNTSDWPRISLLWNLLVEQAPNLKSVCLKHVPYTCETNVEKHVFKKAATSSGKIVDLPNLKYFQYPQLDPFLVFNEIFYAATNLERLYDYSSGTVLLANKFHLITTLNFYESLETLEIMESLSFCAEILNLKTVCVYLYHLMGCMELRSRAKLALLKILVEHSNALTNFELYAPTSLFGFNFQLPQLPKVISVKISTAGVQKYFWESLQLRRMERAGKYFPKKFQFNKTFPQLTHVTFQLAQLYVNEDWEERFDLFEPVHTVKYLKFEKSEFLPRNCMLRCSQIFPNTEFLEIKTKCFNNTDDNGTNGIWTFQYLKELWWDVHTEFEENLYPFLDSALTGFSYKNVRHLYKCQLCSQKIYYNAVDITPGNSLREYPGPIDLKELKYLKLTIIDDSRIVRDDYEPMLTHVSGLFAFKRCPLLHVALRYDVGCKKNLLEIMKKGREVLPYIQSLEDVSPLISYKI